MKKFSVSYIMPCWLLDIDMVNITQNAVESFRASTPDAQLVIIDNASPVGSGYLREAADLYLREKENVGYVPAMVHGMKLADGDFFILTNNDVRISPNWYEVVKDIFYDYKVGSVHPRMTGYDTPFAYGNQIAKTGKERWCTASFWVIRSDVLEYMKLHEPKEPYPGMFDLNYGKGIFDDVDLHCRIRKAGYSTCYTDKCCYQHFHSYTFKKSGNKEWEEGAKKNREYFTTKFGKDPDKYMSGMYPGQFRLGYEEGFQI